jgi:hypothetical protein
LRGRNAFLLLTFVSAEIDDETLWNAFTRGTLPKAEWRHRAHVRVAWMFLERYELDAAHALMRVGIVRLNAVHGLVESLERGYHETLTRGYLVLVAAARKTRMNRTDTSSTFVDACADAIGPEAILRHYSREHLLSAKARALFVEPDLAPLPAV